MAINTSEIIGKATSEIVKDATKFAWDKVKTFFTDMSAKESMEYGYAYEKYLDNTRLRNGKIRTLIYRYVPEDLYSFYECIGVSYNGEIIDTSSVNNLVKNENKIIITGTGGVGKSILFKHLFLNAIRDTCLIPVLIELRSFNSIDVKEISLREAIYNSLSDNGFSLEKRYFDYSMEKGGYIILLDGYDEVNRERTDKITQEIKSICSKYTENKYIVSSRPSEAFIGWNDFAEMAAQSLTKEQAINFVNKIRFDDKIKAMFVKELEDKLYESHKSFAENPLLLTIMLLTFARATIPDRLNDFYELAFSTLFNEHDFTKDAFTREKRTGLGCEDFKRIFSHFCFKSYFREEYEFTEATLHRYIHDAKEKMNINNFRVEDFQDDLLNSVCMLVKDGLYYSFSHRSFQEYFAAWYTCKLTDDVVEKFLLKWMKTSLSISSDSYLTMLYNMQSEKVNKIIFCPFLEELKAEYEKSGGFTIDFISKTINGITIYSDNETETEELELGFYSGNFYLTDSLRLICRLNGHVFSGIEHERPLAKMIFDTRGSDYISIENAIEILGCDGVIRIFEWFHQWVLFGFSLLDKYSDDNLANKTDIASMLDDL